ncbi:MAG: DUF5674 family protein [bacterium]|nr:DUF5674 family protein [bacterium]
MEILVVREPVDQETLDALAKAWHFSLVKGVADISLGTIALGGEWHIDANNRLIEEGSEQKNLWGFNVYPKEKGDAAIEYNSLINIRPMQGNRSMEIESEEIRKAVRRTVAMAVPFLDL